MTPAVEIMINTPTVKKLIEENRLDKLSVAVETGYDDGMQDFNKAVLDLYNGGKISKEEAMLKASNPAALEMNLKGIFLTQGSRILG
jgi:Tfp pilus assembly pilus retraction ATPase PilT